MSYQTGSATNMADLMADLKTFAVAEGWTLNVDNFPTHLNLSINDVYANFAGTTAVFSDAGGTSRTDQRLHCYLATGLGGGGYNSQPDSIVSSTADADGCIVNDLTGPIPSYHFFTGDVGDPAYIAVAIETRAGYYAHFVFGELDQLGQTFDPAPAAMVGTYYVWWNEDTNNSDAQVNWGHADHRYPFDINRLNNIVVPGDAAPAETPVSRLALILHDRTADEFAGDAASLYNSVGTLGTMPISGVTPFFPIPVGLQFNANNEAFYLCGAMPNMRFASMQDRTPAEEVVIGADTWMVFPMRKIQPTNFVTRPTPPIVVNTSHYDGFAYKKIV